MPSVAPSGADLGRGSFRCQVHIRPEEEGGFSVYAATLPGAVSQGDTEAEALANITEALEGILLTYLEADRPIPWSERPRPLEAGETQHWVEVHA
jgi:predicted RNase H-like HicB family nuclease